MDRVVAALGRKTPDGNLDGAEGARLVSTSGTRSRGFSAPGTLAALKPGVARPIEAERLELVGMKGVTVYDLSGFAALPLMPQEAVA